MSDEVSFKEGVDIRTLFMRQVERCAVSSSVMDPAIFETNVRVLLSMLPAHCNKEVIHNTDIYNAKISRLEYQKHCGTQMGKANSPLMDEDKEGTPYRVERDEEGKINWNDPHIISPQLVEKTETDYEELFRLVCEVAENAGLT